jgi:hypothetical protein
MCRWAPLFDGSKGLISQPRPAMLAGGRQFVPALLIQPLLPLLGGALQVGASPTGNGTRTADTIRQVRT